MSTKNLITEFVEIKPDMLKYVLGRERSNLKTLQSKYAQLRIFSTRDGKTGIRIEGSSVNQVDSCIKDINQYVMSAYAYRDNIQRRNRINKEKQAKKKSIQVINRIKDNIKKENEEKAQMEAELKNAEKEGRDVMTLKQRRDEQIIEKRLKQNMFYSLLVEE